MKKIFKGFGLVLMALLLVVTAVPGLAGATTTIAVNAITETGALTVTAGGALTLEGAAASALLMGGALTSGTLTLGNATATGATAYNGAVTGGANTLFNNATTSTISIGAALLGGTLNIGGTGLMTGTVTIAGGTGAQIINIGTGGTGVKTINIGTGAIGNIVTIGTVTAAGSVSVKAGTAGILLGGGTATSTTVNGGFNYIADTGAADVYVATLVPAVTAYTAGLQLYMKVTNVNATTTPTVNVNGLGAKTIVKRAATALAAGDMPAGAIAVLIYDGTNFQLINPIVN